MHWGFLAWAILGSLTTVMLMHYHYDKGLPLAPRTLLYPIFGDRAINGPIGTIADASCIIAVVAGTVGPDRLPGSAGHLRPATRCSAFPTSSRPRRWSLPVLVAIYTLSAVSGINRGIQMLSSINIMLALG